MNLNSKFGIFRKVIEVLTKTTIQYFVRRSPFYYQQYLSESERYDQGAESA